MTPSFLLQGEVAEELHVADGDYGWITPPEEEEAAAFDETRFKGECESRCVLRLPGVGWVNAALGNHATF